MISSVSGLVVDDAENAQGRRGGPARSSTATMRSKESARPSTEMPPRRRPTTAVPRLPIEQRVIRPHAAGEVDPALRRDVVTGRARDGVAGAALPLPTGFVAMRAPTSTFACVVVPTGSVNDEDDVVLVRVWAGDVVAGRVDGAARRRVQERPAVVAARHLPPLNATLPPGATVVSWRGHGYARADIDVGGRRASERIGDRDGVRGACCRRDVGAPAGSIPQG